MALAFQTALTRIAPRLKKDPPPSGRGGKQNIAALDGVRAMAALLVIFFHLNEAAGPPWNLTRYPLLNSTLAMFGASGVELFFSLSGFLLFMPFAKAMLFQSERPSTRSFYLRRIFRIWPAYYFTLAVMVFFFVPEYLHPDHWKQLFLFLTFFMDSSTKTWQQLNGPFWSLATEWQFYMLLPLIALCFSWIVKRFGASPSQRLKVLLACCVGFFTLELFIRYFGFYCQMHLERSIVIQRSALNSILFFTFGVHGKFLEEFAFGMMASACYVYAQHSEFGPALKARLQQFSGRIFLLGIVILIGAYLLLGDALSYMPWYKDIILLHPFEYDYPWLGEPISSLGYSLCMLAILFGSKELRWFFETPLLHWIGLLSFGIYMWHQKLLDYFGEIIVPHLPHLPHILMYGMYWGWFLVIIVPICYLLHILIEKPGIRLGSWIIARKFAPSQTEAVSAK